MGVVALALSTGCLASGPVALQHGARPVGAGKTVAGASTIAMYDVGQGANEGTTSLEVAEVAGFVRYGFTDRIDAGLQVYPGGIRADGKVLLLDGPFALSIDPGVHAGYMRLTTDYEDGSRDRLTAMVTGADLTLIAGMKVGEGEVYVAPRYGYFGVDGKTEASGASSLLSGDNESHVYAKGWGGSVGMRMKVGKMWLIPELGVYQREIYGGDSDGDGKWDPDRDLIWAPSLGFATGF